MGSSQQARRRTRAGVFGASGEVHHRVAACDSSSGRRSRGLSMHIDQTSQRARAERRVRDRARRARCDASWSRELSRNCRCRPRGSGTRFSTRSAHRTPRWYPHLVAYTPEMLAQLEAQRAYFASDEHIRREVAVWRDATPAERLAEAAAMCEAGDAFLSRQDPETLERILRPEPLPADTIELLVALRRSR